MLSGPLPLDQGTMTSLGMLYYCSYLLISSRETRTWSDFAITYYSTAKCDVAANTFTGGIPSEIALLQDLGEYCTVFDRSNDI